jgi:poly(3-hydroxybutyrate) depolymerase
MAFGLALLACSSDDAGDALGSGGSAAAAGSNAANGGAPAAGGTSSGGGSGVAGSGAGAGGASSGGASGGGAGTAGAGATAGSAGTAGSGGDAGSAGSIGCGSTATPESGRFTIDVSGTSREYIIDVPDDYDSSQPYRLVFTWHWRGGSAQIVANDGYYGLRSRSAGSAIFVSPEGIDAGWANTGGRDIAFLRALLDRLEGQLCIDRDRIFSTGFSYGGMMSFAVGCAMADVFRAIAPMSGALYSGCEDGSQPIAVWGAHGTNDDVVPVGDGRTALEVFLERNGCGTATTAVAPSPCVSYEGCDAGHPVVWCEWSGGHSPPPNSAESIWNFFSQF